jgi:hypothetical protein
MTLTVVQLTIRETMISTLFQKNVLDTMFVRIISNLARTWIAAKEQADFEFDQLLPEWIEVPANVSDAIRFAPAH